MAYQAAIIIVLEISIQRTNGIFNDGDLGDVLIKDSNTLVQ